MEFRDNLLFARQQRNMTQEQLAMLLGVSRQSIAKWESGQSTPEVDKLIRMAELFGCSLDELVSGDLSSRAIQPAEVMPAGSSPQDVCGYDQHVHKYAFSIASGIACLWLGIALCILLSGIERLEALPVIGFFIGVIGAAVFIVPVAIGHSSFVREHPFVEDFYTPAQRREVQKLFAGMLTAAICAFILALIAAVVCDWLDTAGDFTVGGAIVCVFFAACSWCLAYGIILKRQTNVERRNARREARHSTLKDPQVRLWCGSILAVAFVIGLLMMIGWLAVDEMYRPHVKSLLGCFGAVWVAGLIASLVAMCVIRLRKARG